MTSAHQIEFRVDWDVIADVAAATIGRGTPAHRAALDAPRGFPDAGERFMLFLENVPDGVRDAFAARLREMVMRQKVPYPELT